MKIHEIVESASISDNVKKHFETENRFIGKGDTASVFLTPRNTVLKVYGPSFQRRDSSADQVMAKTFVSFIKEHPSKYLPVVYSEKEIELDNQHIYIVETEHLSHGSLASAISKCLENYDYKTLSLERVKQLYPRDYEEFTKSYSEQEIHEILTLWRDVQSEGVRHVYSNDIGPENIMFRGNTPVLHDPWTLGF